MKKVKVFFNMYDNFDKENKNIKSLLDKPPLTTQFIWKRRDIDRSTLYSFDGPFQLLQADIAYTRFLAKSPIDPKFCLLFVNLFTSKMYTFPIKTRHLLAKKMEQFCNDTQKKKKWQEKRLQTYDEFKQWKIYYLNKKFNVDTFTMSLRGGKAFAAEQKIREFKKKLLRSKRIEKYNKKRIKANDLIKKQHLIYIKLNQKIWIRTKTNWRKIIKQRNSKGLYTDI